MIQQALLYRQAAICGKCNQGCKEGYNIHREMHLYVMKKVCSLSARGGYAMTGKKFRFAAEIFVFLLWYITLVISATGEKYFDFLSCMFINRVGAYYPLIAVSLLWVVFAVYLTSFLTPKLHRTVRLFLLADGVAGMLLILNAPPFIEGVVREDYRAYFWKPFFDWLGMGLSENALYRWASFSVGLPYVVALANLHKTGWWNNDTRKSVPQSQDVTKIAWSVKIFTFALLAALIAFIVHTGVNKTGIYEERFQSYLEAAQNGDIYSMERVGTFYLRGIGTERNTANGLYWMRQGARSRNFEAMSILGSMYYHGHRTGRDWNKARYWLTAAMEAAPDAKRAAQPRRVLNRIDMGLLPHQ